MTRKLMLAVAVLFVSQFAVASNAFCWSKPKSLSIMPYFGYYNVPGELFELDGSVVTHPPHFVGSMKGVRGSLGWDYWFFGAEYFQAEAHGAGQWARPDTAQTLAQNNVEGVISGKTDWLLEGAAVSVGRKFLDPKSPVRPYVLLGGGLAEVDVNFKGSFDGIETQSGFGMGVHELASDRIKMNVPVFLAEAGLQLILRESLYLSPSVYWNTGYGAKVQLEMKFP